MNFEKSCEIYRDKLVKELVIITDYLSKAPNGYLTCSTKKGKYYYNIKKADGKILHVKADQMHYAEMLAKKHYFSFLCKHEKGCLSKINNFIKSLKDMNSEVSQYAKKHPGISALVNPYSSFENTACTKWQNTLFNSNPFNPEDKCHCTLRGDKVRSKSECIIADMLFSKHIPFRYECALEISDKILYPDFTILHPVTSEIIIWEHLGLMDMPEYRSKAVSKLALLTANGFLPGRNLIISAETNSQKFDSACAEDIINGQILKIF